MADALIRVVVQGDEAVGGLSRIDQAMARLERSQPTLALRSTRRAIDELAVAATGLHPALGRVIATFAELGIGGTTGLAAVGGFAAIAVEMKYLIGYAGALDEKLLKLNTTLAQGTPAGKLLAASAAGARAEELNKPAFFSWENLGPGDMQLASRAGRQSEQATAQNEANLDLAKFHDEHTKRLRAEANALETSNIALERARLETQDDTNARAKALDDLAHRAEVVRLSTEQLTGADRKRILAQDDETRALERTLVPMVKLRAEFTGIAADINDSLAATPHFQATLQGIKVPTLEQLEGAETARRVNLGGDKLVADAISRSLIGVGMGRTSDFGQQAPHGDKEWERIGSALLTGMTMIASARGGNVGAAALGALGETATAASGLKAFAGEAKWLGPAGFALSAASSLSSLFTGGQKPKVIITAFEEEAARQIKELRSDPATTQFILVGSTDIRSTQQALARLGRMGVISRLPR